MKTMVTGRFSAGEQAARVVDKLLQSCIRLDHVRAFFLSPTPRSDADPMGGRQFESWSVGHELGQVVEDSLAAIVAVETSDNVSQALVVNVLRQHGASAIECAAGAWQEERWADLHPIPVSTPL